MNDRELSIQCAYKRGVKDGIAKSQHDDDDAFWLRQYAGMAMQGILANPDIMQHVCGSWFKTDVSVTMWAVKQAAALLEEVKKREVT